MSQYFADIKETEFFITDEEAHHLIQVARCREGDDIVVFDGKGQQYKAHIDRVQKKFVRGTLVKKLAARRPPLGVELCFAPNSRTGMEEVLDKCTQIGVTSFQPILTLRSEYDLLKKWDNKNERWHQIMVSACKQSNTPYVPQIKPPVKFLAALEERKPSLIAYEAEETHTLAWGMETLGQPKAVRVFVGPAGGWADEEIVIAAQYGVLPVTLGVNILRAETACIVAAAKLL